MKYSKLFIPTLKESPADADNVSIKLMLRSGMVRKLSSGIYEWLPLGLKVLKKVENIIREEMNKIDGQEVWLPILQPRDLWEETGRWGVYGKELFRLKDRKESDFCLGPTHEEVITDIVRKDVRSYKELPLMLYQFGIKFRDEIRPRFGVMRAREFYMKDAYSFHATEDDAENYYHKVYNAYKKICERCGFKYRDVEAITGAIGGKFSHEFMVLAETGEEVIAHCDCGYGANVEKAECVRYEPRAMSHEPLTTKEIHTPKMKTVEEVGAFLKLPSSQFIKTLVYIANNVPYIVLVRGDCEINESKLAQHLGVAEVELAPAEIVQKITGAALGFAGPVNLPSSAKDIKILADYSVENIENGVSGANRNDYHLVNITIYRDYTPSEILDLRCTKEGDICPKCKRGKLQFSRGIEIGHTFKLGKKYSELLNATFLDSDGMAKHFIMGCYGIGVSRIIAAAIEQNNDKDGIIWHLNIAPFQVVISPVDYADERIRAASYKIYNELLSNNIEVLLDDRDERAGIKFKDADLLGIPLRITVGKKKLNEGKVELKLRKESSAKDIPLESATQKTIKILSGIID